jgi:hypothetical protein
LKWCRKSSSAGVRIQASLIGFIIAQSPEF